MEGRIVSQLVSALIVITIVAGGVSFGAEKKRSVKQQTIKAKSLPTKEEKVNYSTKPFDIKATALPFGYTGHDIIALYNRLSKAFPPKGEYESTEEYHRRLRGEYPNETFAFLIENVSTAISASYDPDDQNMLIKINADGARNHDGFRERMSKSESPSSHYDLISAYETVIKVRHIRGASEKYMARNKMGAKTVVTKLTGKEYGIGLNNKGLFAMPGYSITRTRNITLKIPPEEARDLKSNLGILLICRVRPWGDPFAYSFRSVYHSEPTMNSPTELSFSQYFVNVDLLEIWIFNRRTGTVCAKDVIAPQDQEGIDPNKT